MKILHIFPFILLISFSSNAQRTGLHNNRQVRLNKRSGYFNFTCGISSNPFYTNAGNIHVHVPYSINSVNGNMNMSGNFSQSLNAGNRPRVMLYGIEYAKGKFYGETMLGGNASACIYSNGSGMRFVTPNQHFAVKAGMNFNINYEYENMGNIDNRNKTIDIEGKLFNPTFKYTTGSGHSSSTHIAYSDHIDVQYRQVNFNLIPKISLEYFMAQQRVSIRLNLMYNLTNWEKQYICFRQYSTGGHGGARKVDNINHDSTGYDFQSVPGQTNPFDVHKFMVGVDVGILLFSKQSWR